MARLIGFVWNKAASMGFDASAFESTYMYPSNRNQESEYCYSISDTSETITFMERATPDMAPICAPSTSGTNNLCHLCQQDLH
jgi:hypothetical protein